MHSPEEARTMMDAGEHVVEIAVTWLDGTYESFYPSAEGGWQSSVFHPDMQSDFLIVNGKTRCNRLEIPLHNVRYYEVIVHNDPMTDHVCDENCGRLEVDRNGPRGPILMAFKMSADGTVEETRLAPGQYL